MKTFENLIPKLHKKHYVKENTTNQTISIYKNNKYGLSATVTLNHNTGQAIFTFRYLPIMPFKLKRDPIPNADQHICIDYGNGKLRNEVCTIDIPNPTYADVLDDTYDYVIRHNHYDTHVLETKTKRLYNGDYVTTTNGLYIIDIPEGQSIVTKYPEKLSLPLTNIVTDEHITTSFTDIVTTRNDTFYHNLYALYTGESTETKGYLKAAHQFDKTLKELIDRAILKHALSSKEAFKQALQELCDKYKGYINTRGTYFLDGSDIQYYTSLNGDNVITEEAKYDTSNYSMHLIKRTATPINLYMKRIEERQPKINSDLYDAIDVMGERFIQTRYFRPRPKTL